MEYSFTVGLKKSLKNILITYVLPATALLVANYAEWLPTETAVKVAPVIGFVSYLLANYMKNR